jgi:uncharacterized protein YfaS (alpha-2-macroglobulin family)
VLNTVDMLANRFHGYAFSSWPHGYDGDMFLLAYAADFLTTAREMGVFLPHNLDRSVMDSLRDWASSSPTSLDTARIKAYAAWVLTRNGVLTSNIMATLTAWLDRYQKDWKSDLTAVFMAGCWQLMMERDEAARLLDGYRFEPGRSQPRSGYGIDSLSERAFHLSVLAAHFPDRLDTPETGALLDEILELARARVYVTISAAQTARALMLYSRGATPPAAEDAITILDANGAVLPMPEARYNHHVLETALEAGEEGNPLLADMASLVFRTAGSAFWQTESTGFDRAFPAEPLAQGMELERQLRTPDGQPVVSVKAGDEVVMVIRARSHGNALNDVAITDLLPGGFEMILAEGGQEVDSGTALGRMPQDVSLQVNHAERREDRLLLFPSLNPRQDGVYRYRVRAAVRGVFTLPPLYGEAMYDPTIRARSATGTIVVE